MEYIASMMMKCLLDDRFFNAELETWTHVQQPGGCDMPLACAVCQFILSPIKQLITAFMQDSKEKYDKMLRTRRFYTFGRVFSGTIATGLRVRIQGPHLEPVGLEDMDVQSIQRMVRLMSLSTEAAPLVVFAIEESGEHVIAGCGELHDEICLKDSREESAQCEFTVGDPVVSYRDALTEESSQVCLSTGLVVLWFVKCMGMLRPHGQRMCCLHLVPTDDYLTSSVASCVRGATFRRPRCGTF